MKPKIGEHMVISVHQSRLVELRIYDVNISDERCFAKQKTNSSRLLKSLRNYKGRFYAWMVLGYSAMWLGKPPPSGVLG